MVTKAMELEVGRLAETDRQNLGSSLLRTIMCNGRGSI